MRGKGGRRERRSSPISNIGCGPVGREGLSVTLSKRRGFRHDPECRHRSSLPWRNCLHLSYRVFGEIGGGNRGVFSSHTTSILHGRALLGSEAVVCFPVVRPAPMPAVCK